MFELFVRQMEKSGVETQQLLEPVVIPLTPQEMNTYEDLTDTLNEMGFETNQWDPTSIAVHSYPILIKNIETSVKNILAGEKVNKSDYAALAMRACKASVRAGDKLSAEQAEFQREQLLNCLDPFTCPHGRPIVLELTDQFLDKQFLRT